MVILNQAFRRPLTVVGLVTTLCLWFLPGICSAGEILLSVVGSGQWQVSSTGLNNVLALDLELRYDPQRLLGLSATAGKGLTGAMTVINDKVPGVIRLGAIASQPLPQSSLLLKLQSSAPEAELVVTKFTVVAVDKDGKLVPTTIQQQLLPQNLPVIPTETEPSSAAPTPTAQPLTETPHRGGESSLGSAPPLFQEASQPELPAADEQPSPPLPAFDSTETATTSPAATEFAATVREKHFHAQEELVAAILRLPQPWTVAAVQAIFLQAATASPIHQEPPVALADGRSKVKLSLPKTFSQKQPAVGVQGCSLSTIGEDKEQGWQIELVTSRDSWPVTALLLGDKDLIQFPVVIVPAFNTFTPPASNDSVIPSDDFDGDGKITAIDAYLYVGNLLGHSASGEILPIAQQPRPPRQ